MKTWMSTRESLKGHLEAPLSTLIGEIFFNNISILHEVDRFTRSTAMWLLAVTYALAVGGMCVEPVGTDEDGSDVSHDHGPDWLLDDGEWCWVFEVSRLEVHDVLLARPLGFCVCCGMRQSRS